MFRWGQYIWNFWGNSLHPVYWTEEKFKTFEECRADYYKFKERVRDIPDAPMATIFHIDLQHAKLVDEQSRPGKLFYWKLIKRRWICDCFDSPKEEPTYITTSMSEEGFKSLSSCLSDYRKVKPTDVNGFSVVEAPIR